MVGRKPLQRLLGENLRRRDRKLEHRGIITVALIRKVPVAPFTIVNMAMGASAIRFRDFVAGTALGMVPGIAAFALVGDGLMRVWREPNIVNVSIVIGAVALWIGVVLGMQKWVNRLGAEMTKRRMQLLKPHVGEIATTAAQTFPGGVAAVALGAMAVGAMLFARSNANGSRSRWSDTSWSASLPGNGRRPLIISNNTTPSA